MDDLPGHNSSYKRALLLDYGPELESMLDAEWILHRDLRRRGYALYLEPAAMSRHVSPSRLVPSLVQWFHYSRGFATSRSRGWPGARRALYAAGSPLIVLVRLRGVIAAMRRTGQAQADRAGVAAGRADAGCEAPPGSWSATRSAVARGLREAREYELHRDRYADGYDEITSRT